MILEPEINMKKCKIILGTAGWGTRANFVESAAILDHFLASGGELVDSSTNYPISQGHAFGKTLEVISNSKNLRKSKLLVKVGAATNTGSPDQLLSPSYLDLSQKHLQSMLGESLFAIGIHFDNRTDSQSIKDTCDKLIEFEECDLLIGLSGISSPHLYAEHLARLRSPILFQINLSRTSLNEVMGIRNLFPEIEIYGYGLFGGIRNKPETMEQTDSIHREHDANYLLNKIIGAKNAFGLDGLIIGPSSVAQMSHYIEVVNEQGCDFEF